MEYHVEIIPQQTENTCWAASMAMLLQYFAGQGGPEGSRPWSPFRTGFTPEYVANQVGGVIAIAYQRDQMLTTNFRDNFVHLANPWHLDHKFDFNNVPAAEWDRLLRAHGPYFLLDNRIYNDHAVIVSGINVTSDQLTIVDPWPVGTGDRYTIRRSNLAPTGTVIHAGRDTVVLHPGRGGGS
ncbi:MAG: hypothetical protein K1X57_05060 [Gemmataceae bacterium]|nr:hypothetical protein [Gemmataceae bacterium]